MRVVKIAAISILWVLSVYIASNYFLSEPRQGKITSDESAEVGAIIDTTVKLTTETRSTKITSQAKQVSKVTKISDSLTLENAQSQPYRYDVHEVLKKNKKADQAYGNFFRNKNKEEAFLNDEYDSEWSGKITNLIQNEILFNSESGENRYSALDLESLTCKGSICKLEIRMTGDEENNDKQRTDLMYALLYMNNGNPADYTGEVSKFASNRMVSTGFYGENGYRFYISKGVNELNN